MLPKKNRASTEKVSKVFKNGSFVNSTALTFKYFKDIDKAVKISFIAPKNIAKSSVKRNLLRRRGYSALGRHFSRFPVGVIGVFMFKKYEDDVSILENEIKNILGKIN